MARYGGVVAVTAFENGNNGELMSAVRFHDEACPKHGQN